MHQVLLVHHLLVVGRHILRSIVNGVAFDEALLDLLTELNLLPLRQWTRRRWRCAVVHGHLLESFSRVVGVEERLLGWKVELYGSYSALCLSLLTREGSAARGRLVLRLHDLICGRYVTVVVAPSPGLLRGDFIAFKSAKTVRNSPLDAPWVDNGFEFAAGGRPLGCMALDDAQVASEDHSKSLSRVNV